MVKTDRDHHGSGEPGGREQGDCAVGGWRSRLGAVNGGANSGPNFQLQADANTSFVRAVPEPDSVALFGLGLGLVGLFAKRRARKQA